VNGPGNSTSAKERDHCPPSAADILFLLTGAIAGAATGVYAYDRTSSLPLSLFIFAMVMYVVGAGPLHVLGKPHAVQHIVFVVLLPVASGVLFSAANTLWGNEWIALLVGIVLGGTLHRAIARITLPAIAEEERSAHARRGRAETG
jgi:hypothetical protein